MAQMIYFQHGDVLIKAVKAIPPDARLLSTQILVTGEVTGHAHRLVDNADVSVYEHEGTLFLRVGPGGAGVIHEEHRLGVVSAGEYQIDRVLEYDHFREEARAVQD